MATVSIIDRGCRGCTLCVDICPVDVFEQDEATETARSCVEEDCIGCLSCFYVCPSQCVEVGGRRAASTVPPHRAGRCTCREVSAGEDGFDEPDRRLILTRPHADVAARLMALGDAVVETMGRGHKAVGRRAGAVAASHMPEMYEETGPRRDHSRNASAHSRAPSYSTTRSPTSPSISLSSPAGSVRSSRDAGEKVGDAVLCEIFHEYWAGLLTAYVGETYKFEIPKAGPICEMKLFPAR